MTNQEFISILTDVVALGAEAHIYNTAFIGFKYDLIVKNGRLQIVVTFPTYDKQLTITQDDATWDSLNSMLDDARQHINLKKK